MPPSATGARKAIKGPVESSKSRDLVHTGPKHVTQHRSPWAGTRDKHGRKPSTTKALVLRDQAMGKGEIVHMGKLGGRQKLELLADDLIRKAQQALAQPFDFERCLKIADAQFNAYLDDISALRDPARFRNVIEAEVRARTPPKRNPKDVDMTKNQDNIAHVVAISIHNAYMLASIWKLVRNLVLELYDKFGVDGSLLRDDLVKNKELRADYLVVYDIVSELVAAGHQEFAVLLTKTPHYQQYFKPAPGSKGDDPDVDFDWDALRSSYKSFLDSIMIELALPGSRIPKRILLQILGEGCIESPREAKRFPQGLWDAVGDLSSMVDLLEMLEGPLRGPESQQWKSEPRDMPEEYEKWQDAQIFSSEAVNEFRHLKEMVNPLEMMKKKVNLDRLWQQVNNNYEAKCGQKIQTLWDLEGELERSPTWHGYYKQHKSRDIDSDDDMPGLTGIRRRGKKPLALTEGGEESDDSMPSLQSVSDSSDEDTDEEDDDEFYEDDEGWEDADTESEYDEDDDEEYRRLAREAMDEAMTNPDFLDPKAPTTKELEEMIKNRTDNPFLKLLGSLRGRMFSSKGNVKTTSRPQPRTPFEATTPKYAPKPSAKAGAAGGDGMPPLEKIPQAKKAGVTMEEVEDEEVTKKKKKKKPKKKKKKSAAGGGTDAALDDAEESDEEEEPPRAATPPPQSPPETTPSSPPAANKNKKKKKAGGSGLGVRPAAGSTSTLAGSTLAGSTATLPTFTEAPQAAQSARSYLKEQKIEAKEKKKSRPGYGTLSNITEKMPIWARLSSRTTGEPAEAPDKAAKQSWFAKLGKKTNTYMHQLLRTSEDEKKGQAGMKWEHFVKLMTDMGFTYDGGTAGSSVRFDPADPSNPSITFHRPHPDPTIHPKMLLEFKKRLVATYQWSEEDFMNK